MVVKIGVLEEPLWRPGLLSSSARRWDCSAIRENGSIGGADSGGIFLSSSNQSLYSLMY